MSRHPKVKRNPKTTVVTWTHKTKTKAHKKSSKHESLFGSTGYTKKVSKKKPKGW